VTTLHVRLGLPGAVKVAVLVDPAVPPTATTLREVEAVTGASVAKAALISALLLALRT
jgi:hypothetical protein